MLELIKSDQERTTFLSPCRISTRRKMSLEVVPPAPETLVWPVAAGMQGSNQRSYLRQTNFMAHGLVAIILTRTNMSLFRRAFRHADIGLNDGHCYRDEAWLGTFLWVDNRDFGAMCG